MKIDHKIVMCGIICLTIIYIGLLINGDNQDVIGYLIIMIIAFAIGIVVPGPRIDNKRGCLEW